MPPDLALESTLIGSNYSCLEQIFMVPKVFEPQKFYCSCIFVSSRWAIVIDICPSSVVRQSVHLSVRQQFLQTTFPPRSNARFQNNFTEMFLGWLPTKICLNCSAPLNKMAARAKNRKNFKWHLLLDQWTDFKIILRKASLMTLYQNC